MAKKVLLLFAISAVFGCAPETSPEEMAQEEIFVFHQKYDTGDSAAIYAESSIRFKNAVDEKDFDRMLQELHIKAGDHLDSTVVHINRVFEFTGTTVILSLQSQFEHAVLFEEFVYIAEKGKYRLAGYHYQGERDAGAELADVET